MQSPLTNSIIVYPKYLAVSQKKVPKLFKGTQKYIDLGKVKHYLSHEEIEKRKIH